MNFLFTPDGWDDYLYWEENDKKTRRKINLLLQDIARNGAFSGIGKPEPLSGNFCGFFSRRIDEKNRLIYKVEHENVIVLSCRYHYLDK